LTAVRILTCNRQDTPESLWGNTLTLKSIRTGFPTADVEVWDNASDFGVDEIEAAAVAAGARFVPMDKRIEHWQWLDQMVRSTRGELVIVDPDVVFWKEFPGGGGQDARESDHFDKLFKSKRSGLMFGRYIAENGGYLAKTPPRLHTSLLFIPDAQALCIAIDEVARQTYDFRGWQPCSWREGGRMVHIDTGAAIYASLQPHCRGFDEDVLDTYDHMVSGTALDWWEKAEKAGHVRRDVLAAMRSAHQRARADITSVKGLWREQEWWFRGVGSQVDAFFRWSNRNPDAADLMADIHRLSQAIDDLVDGDTPNAVGLAGSVLSAALIDLPCNPFYRRFENELRPCIKMATLMWQASEDLREINPAFGYAWRESTALVLAMIATLAGNDGRAVLKEIHEYYHTHGVETFAEWEAANG